MEELVQHIKKYATVKNLGPVAVLSEDVGGLTYVARWVRTDLIEDIPDGASWADITKEQK